MRIGVRLYPVECPPCVVCGERPVLSLTGDQLARLEESNRLRTVIQSALPDLSVDEREMLINGTHPGCWKKMMGEE